MAIVGGALFPLVLGFIAKTTGSLALGYIVPLLGFVVVALYGFLAPRIQPEPGNTSPDAGPIVAARGHI
jgi:FHS family L-fucose permease-like MFS transporter